MLVTFFHCQVAYEGFIPEKQQPRLSTDQEFGCYSYCVFLYHCEGQYVEMTYFCMEYIRPAPAMAFNSPFYLFYLLLYASSPFSESC